MTKSKNPADKQTSHTGKVMNDSNKQGGQAVTQTNEPQRTPKSRHDRDTQIGNNQSHMRQGGPNGGDQSGRR